MPKFIYEENIGSCHVSKDLLSEIEEYLLLEMPKQYGTSLGEDTNYRVSISEQIGTETLESIKDYTLSIFPNNIKHIEVEWDNGYSAETRLDISLRIDSGRLFTLSRIRISCTSPVARETAESIGKTLLRIIETRKTHNWLLNPTREGGLPLIFSLLGFFLIGLAIVLWINGQIHYVWLIATGAFSPLVQRFRFFFRRYYTFETARQVNT